METTETYTTIQWDCPKCSFVNEIDDPESENDEVCDGCNREVKVYHDK